MALNHVHWGQELGLPRVSIFVAAYVYLGAVTWLLAR